MKGQSRSQWIHHAGNGAHAQFLAMLYAFMLYRIKLTQANKAWSIVDLQAQAMTTTHFDDPITVDDAPPAARLICFVFCIFCVMHVDENFLGACGYKLS